MSFYRQVTLRLCGNLDLETGVTQCLQYLSRFLPADGLIVRQLEPELQSERVLAESFGVFHQKSGTLTPLLTRERNPADRPRIPRLRIIHRPEQSASMQPYTQMFGHEISCISMPLMHHKKAIGVAVLGLEGKNRYREEHMQLFGLLHDPFVLALSNNIKHREMIRLKNLIEAEKKDLTMERLITYPWPGNVRELGNVIERELILKKAGRSRLITSFPGRQTVIRRSIPLRMRMFWKWTRPLPAISLPGDTTVSQPFASLRSPATIILTMCS